MSVNKYRCQWESVEDNLASAMPFHLYRVTWKDLENNYHEFWSEKINLALEKKDKIDQSRVLEYINFESWYAYRSEVYDKRLKNIYFYKEELEFMNVNKYRYHWENEEDGLATKMPFKLYRVTWKDSVNNYHEFWSEKFSLADKKKYEIDDSRVFEYINFESWYAYRSDVYDRRLKNIVVYKE